MKELKLWKHNPESKMRRNNQKYNNITIIAKSQCTEHGKKNNYNKKKLEVYLKKQKQKNNRKWADLIVKTNYWQVSRICGASETVTKKR